MTDLKLQPNGLVELPSTIPSFIEPYLPQKDTNKPFITLTYAQSIDAKIAITGQRTVISHLETKTMTHYIRSRHDAILIGYKTAIIDDPKLNNRFNNKKIRPVILDPESKWDFKGSSLERLVDSGEGLAPIVIVRNTEKDRRDVITKKSDLSAKGGSIHFLSSLSDDDDNLSWKSIFEELHNLGLFSIMVEGGANIIKQLLLENELIDSLIVTIGSVYLGDDGVDISPKTRVELKDIDWWKGTTDSVMVARLK